MGMDKKLEKRKGLSKKQWIIVISAALFITFIVSLIQGSSASTYYIEKDKITITEVRQGTFKDYININGSVAPIRTIYLDAEEGGKVEKRLKEEGEMVKTGDVILQLRNGDLKMTIMNSESNLAYHTNELRNTQISIEQQKIHNKQELLTIDHNLVRYHRNYLRNKAFYDEGLISEEEFLVIKEDYELAQKNRELIYQKMIQDSIFRENQKQHMDENLKNMRLSLSLVRQRLDNLHVKAPVDGQLGLLDVEIGQSIAKGERIGQINDLSNFKVSALVDEHYIDRVKPALLASIERNEVPYELKIRKVYPEVREGSFEVDLIFTSTKPDNIRTGQTYNLRLELGQPREAVLLPRGAFFQDTGGQWIYVVNQSNEEAEKRLIKLGRQNPKYYEVLEGLEPGEQVVTSAYAGFEEIEKLLFK